jgi:hypothetical protein
MAAQKVYPDSITIQDKQYPDAKAFLGKSYRGYDNCSLKFDCKEVKFVVQGDTAYIVGHFTHISDCKLASDYKADVPYPVTLWIEFHKSTYKRYDFDKKQDVDVEPSTPEKFAYYICEQLGANTLVEAIPYSGIINLSESASMLDLLDSEADLSPKQKERAWEHHCKLIVLGEPKTLTGEACKVISPMMSAAATKGGAYQKAFKTPSQVVDERAEAIVKAANLICGNESNPIQTVQQIFGLLVSDDAPSDREQFKFMLSLLVK